MKLSSLTIMAALLGMSVPGMTQDAPALPGGALAPPGSSDGGEAAAGAEQEEEPEIAAIRRSNFVISKIRDNFREVDPFGMLMDPANSAATSSLADQYSELEDEPQALTNSSLKNALETLPITGIYPQKRMVVIGARTLRPGGQFGMQLDELTIRLRFEGIKGKSLFFRDMDTQEVTSIDFNPLPKEFERITDNTQPKTGQGIVPMNDLFIVN